ncbi:Transcription initiation factor TFIID subunit 3, partial [Ophiophagus hannah]
HPRGKARRQGPVSLATTGLASQVCPRPPSKAKSLKRMAGDDLTRFPTFARGFVAAEEELNCQRANLERPGPGGHGPKPSQHLARKAWILISCKVEEKERKEKKEKRQTEEREKRKEGKKGKKERKSEQVRKAGREGEGRKEGKKEGSEANVHLCGFPRVFVSNCVSRVGARGLLPPPSFDPSPPPHHPRLPFEAPHIRGFCWPKGEGAAREWAGGRAEETLLINRVIKEALFFPIQNK